MLRPNKIIPKKPCPFCGAFLENEAPRTIWCHPRNSCLLSLRGIVGADQIVQWDTSKFNYSQPVAESRLIFGWACFFVYMKKKGPIS